MYECQYSLVKFYNNDLNVFVRLYVCLLGLVFWLCWVWSFGNADVKRAVCWWSVGGGGGYW